VEWAGRGGEFGHRDRRCARQALCCSKKKGEQGWRVPRPARPRWEGGPAASAPGARQVAWGEREREKNTAGRPGARVCFFPRDPWRLWDSEGRGSRTPKGLRLCGGEGEVANLSGGHAPRETSAVSASERARAGASLSPTLLLAALFSGTQHLACPHQLALPDRTPTTPQPMLYTLYGLAGAVRGRVRVEWWGRRAASPRRKFTQKKQIPSSSSFFHQVVGATEGLVRALPRAVSVPAPVPVAPPVSNRADMVRAAGRGERERKRTPFICAPALPTPCSRSLPVPPISPSTPPATRPAWWRSSSWATAGMRRGDGDGE
jgi:hypothetical protein